MNDGYLDSFDDTASDSDNGYYEESADSTETESESISDTDNTLSDTVGNDTLLSSDTENNAEDITENQTDFTETALENQTENSETGSEISSDSSQDIDYLSEIEYIDFLLNTQIDEMQSVKSVSGNSINVTIDSSGTEILQNISDNQVIMIDNQNVIINLLSCILLAIVMEYLINSAKRVMKKMSFRKE